MKETFDMLELIKIKNLLCEKTTSREREDKLWVGRKYFQNTHLIKDYYLKYTKKTPLKLLKLNNKKTNNPIKQ